MKRGDFLTSSHRSWSIFHPLCGCLPRFCRVCLNPISVPYSTLMNVQFCLILYCSLCACCLLCFDKGKSRREAAPRKVLVDQTYCILYFLWVPSICYSVFWSSPHKKTKDFCSVSYKVMVPSRVQPTGLRQTSPMVCKHCVHVLRYTTFVTPHYACRL